MSTLSRSRFALGCAVAILLAAPLAAQGQRPQAKNFVTHLSGDQEVPLRDTSAAGQAIFHLSEDGLSLRYKLIVANINNVVASHIHLGVAGVNGPVVAFLAGPFAGRRRAHRRHFGRRDHHGGESDRAAGGAATVGAHRGPANGGDIRERAHQRRCRSRQLRGGRRGNPRPDPRCGTTGAVTVGVRELWSWSRAACPPKDLVPCRA